MRQGTAKIVYIATLEGYEVHYYDFVCPECTGASILATGIGRYGNLGPFDCPHCDHSFYATNDDFARAWLYVDRVQRGIVLTPLSKEDSKRFKKK